MTADKLLAKFRSLCTTVASSSASWQLERSLRKLGEAGQMTTDYPEPAEISHDAFAGFIADLRQQFNAADLKNPHTGVAAAEDPHVRGSFVQGHLALYQLRHAMGGISMKDQGYSPYDIEEELR